MWFTVACLALVAAASLLPATAAASLSEPIELPSPVVRSAEIDVARPMPSPEAPRRPVAHGPYATSFTPYASLVTEDVDLVEVAAAIGPIAVWPNEGVIHFMDIATPAGVPPTPLVSLPLPSPNISGVDFVADAAGTMGAFATLGFLHLFDLTTFPPSIVASVALPGTPARRDVDPIVVAGGSAVIYPTGTEIHCIAYPSGALLWTLPLPSPVVEAVDPVVNAAETRLLIPTESFMTIHDISVLPAPALMASHFLATTLVREVDARLAVADALCYLPATGSLFVFDVGTAAWIASLPLGSFLIEGNDMEIDPLGIYGFLPTLAFMHQVDLAGMFIAASHPFSGVVHQRNIDTIFSDPLAIGPGLRALYPVQSLTFVYDVFGLAVVTALPTPGTLVDGVDAALTDTPAPPGYTALLSTLGFTHIIDMAAPLVTLLATPGTLRTDVDPKPGPMLANRILQPTLGGVIQVDGFGPNDWVVSTAAGLHVVDVAAAAAVAFLPTPLLYRGGDAQPTTTLPGVPEPAASVDDPDQDFLTKCWEYKFATHRWPYWYSYSSTFMYPHWVPFGVFGPPAQLGYDLLNHVKAVLTDAPSIVLLNEHGIGFQNILLPAKPIGGLIWDWDNKICKVRLYGQLEAVVDLSPIPTTGFATISFVPYGTRTHWFPIVDRMNGWEFVVLRGGRRVWVYDHLRGVHIATVNLAARVIRRPVFDEQRKTLCLPLASRQCAFLSAWKLAVGLPDYLYYTPHLPAQIVGSPVFDLYNHVTLLKLHGGRIAICNTDNGALMWDSGILPYWPISPFQVDCYNKIGKGFFTDGPSFYEMHLNLYPMVFGGAPLLTWLPLGGRPWGYPWFDSKDGYEFVRVGDFDIQYNHLFNPFISGTITTPFPMIGNVFFDRVNKYGLVRLRDPGGGGMLFWMNLHRVTSGLPGATQLITWVDPFEDDVAFDTQGHYAAVHTSAGQWGLVDMHDGVFTHISGPGFPALRRQLVSHPFRHLINYPFDDPGFGGAGEVTIDTSPIRWNPPQLPNTSLTFTPTPLEASDFTPPPPVSLALTHQIPHLPDDLGGLKTFEFLPGALEPGSIVQAHNQSTYETPLMDEPNEDVAEDDGSGMITVVAGNGDLICFRVFDASGNAAGFNCVNALPLEVAEAERAFAFALRGEHPVRAGATLAFTLPEATRATIEVFDVAGRLVRTLADESFEAGAHERTWDLGDGVRPVAAGVYFARIEAGPHRAMVRIAVVR